MARWCAIAPIILLLAPVATHNLHYLFASANVPPLQSGSGFPLSTTVLYGTTAVTRVIHPESTPVPLAGISLADIVSVQIEGGVTKATYLLAEPTTFIVPSQCGSWHIQVGEETIIAPSGVQIIYQTPCLKRKPASEILSCESSLSPAPASTLPANAALSAPLLYSPTTLMATTVTETITLDDCARDCHTTVDHLVSCTNMKIISRETLTSFIERTIVTTVTIPAPSAVTHSMNVLVERIIELAPSVIFQTVTVTERIQTRAMSADCDCNPATETGTIAPLDSTIFAVTPHVIPPMPSPRSIHTSHTPYEPISGTYPAMDRHPTTLPLETSSPAGAPEPDPVTFDTEMVPAEHNGSKTVCIPQIVRRWTAIKVASAPNTPYTIRIPEDSVPSSDNPKITLLVVDAGYRTESYTLSIFNRTSFAEEIIGSTSPFEPDDLQLCGWMPQDAVNCLAGGWSSAAFVLPSDVGSVKIWTFYTARYTGRGVSV